MQELEIEAEVEVATDGKVDVVGEVEVGVGKDARGEKAVAAVVEQRKACSVSASCVYIVLFCLASGSACFFVRLGRFARWCWLVLLAMI